VAAWNVGIWWRSP